jgi:hypothetical protein
MGMLRRYLQDINTQNPTKLKKSQNPFGKVEFSQNSSKEWIFMLELNQPKPLGGNDSQVSLHILIQLKICQNLRFKEITKGKRRGTLEEEEHQNKKNTRTRT